MRVTVSAKALVVVCLGLAIVGPSAEADTVLGSFQIHDSGGTMGVLDTMQVSYGVSSMGFPFTYVFFAEDITIGAADVGTTWTSSPAATALILDQLRDADRDALGVKVALPPPWGGPPMESFVGIAEADFHSVGVDLDLVATRTDEIRVTLLSLSMDSPGSDPLGNGNWTDYADSYQFDFVEVPEPGAMALLAIGAFRARRRA